MAIDTITDPMPQELGTAKILVEEGLGQRLYTAEDIVTIAENMVLREEFAARPLPTAHQLDRVDAVFEIAETILKMAAVELGPVSVGHLLDSGDSIIDSGDAIASCSSPI
jgi:hypothetical protein